MFDLVRLHAHLQLNHHPQTIQRDRLFQAIARRQPISAAALAKYLCEHVSRSTIYRDLKIFERAGIIERATDYTFQLTDRFDQHHHERVCRSCGRRDRFYNEVLERALAKYAVKANFHLEEHQLNLIGLCRQCQPHTPAHSVSGLVFRRPPERIKAYAQPKRVE